MNVRHYLKVFYHRIRLESWSFFHTLLCKKYRKRFTNPDVTIISVNCVGGILYHDLAMPFVSPTINMYMTAADFIKFCEELEFYLSIEKFEECTDPEKVEGREYPVVKLGDICIYLVHYKDINEAQKKWDRRKTRINKSNIVIFCSDREGMNQGLVDRFEKLPYKKILFTNIPDKYRGDSLYYIKGYESEQCVGIVTEQRGWIGLRPIDQFDWISFLNNSH